MTLLERVGSETRGAAVCAQVLDRFFSGERDAATLQLLA